MNATERRGLRGSFCSAALLDGLDLSIPLGMHLVATTPTLRGISPSICQAPEENG